MSARRLPPPLRQGLVLLLSLAACAEGEGDGKPKDAGDSFSYPLDDTLRPTDLQALGTHNSYHVEMPDNVLEDWNYTHRPLNEQLGLLGVRQFELDLHPPAVPGDPLPVYHLPLLDEGTTCARFIDCLQVMKDWSDSNPAHHLLVTLVEPKDVWNPDWGPDFLTQMDEDLRSVWPEDRLLTPDDLQRDTTSVREGLLAYGWPTLGELRGQALFVLHDHEEYREVYTDGLSTSAGRALFPDAFGDLSLPFAAVHSINDAVGGAEAISAAHAAGHLVRTMADGEGEAGRDLALASGANFVTTDWPEPQPGTGYVVEIPGGTPSRCNPLGAAEGCTSEAIEDPAYIED